MKDDTERTYIDTDTILGNRRFKSSVVGLDPDQDPHQIER